MGAHQKNIIKLKKLLDQTEADQVTDNEKPPKPNKQK